MQKFWITSGKKIASAVILTGPGYIHGFRVLTDGTNTGRVILYDSASATTDEDKIIDEDAAVGADLKGGNMNLDCEVQRGLYVAVSGTGAYYVVVYSPASRV